MKEMKPKGEHKAIPWGSRAVSFVLVVLLLVSAAQTVQSASVLSKIKSGAVKSAAASNSSSGILPASLSDQPDMVGGC